MTRKLPAWLPASQALDLLQVRPQTLYANVSRGRIRAKPDPADARRSLYHRDDLQRLAARAHGRRPSEAVAGEAIRWGEPVLPSALSTVAGGRLYYRGQDACALADQASLEAVAALLWDGPLAHFAPSAPPEPAPLARSHRVTGAARRAGADAAVLPLQAALVALAARAGSDPPMRGRSRAVLLAEGADVVGVLAAAFVGPAAGSGPSQRPLHQQLAKGWGRPQAADALRRALVLMADHELNASTFAARVAASTGASLAAGVLAGLATLSGPLHGGAYRGVQALLRAAATCGAEAAVREWLAHDRPLAAFGHPLYPAGDPRCAALLAAVELPPEFAALRAAGERLVGEPPNVDFALAALAATHRLPAQAPLMLFALARSVGWIAHALEQHAAGGGPIRPRARYVGPAPGAPIMPA